VDKKKKSVSRTC